MVEHPFVGVGGGAFHIAEGVTRGAAGTWWAAHNSYLQVGAELGLGGFVLFFWFLYSALRNTRTTIRLVAGRNGGEDTARMARGLESSLWTFMVGALALSQAYAYVLYILVALTIVVKRAAVEERPS
jgi:O-antigen ligase